jgi:hypothetical protein
LRLAAFLLVILFGMHYLPSIIALGYVEQTAAAKAWQYILNGMGVACLLGLLGVFARSAVAWPFIAWGMVESSMQSVCRLGKPIGGQVASAPPFSGLCGVDAYYLGVIAVGWLAFSWLDKRKK